MFLCLFGCFRDCLQFSLLINFCPPWNHQKTIDSVMISGTIEAKLFACILSVLKVKFRDDTLPCLAYCFLQASLGISRFAWPEPVLVRRKIIRIFFHICSVELPAGWISLSRSRAIWNITPSWTFFPVP